jgi:anti-sigma B factor antagonist
MSDQVRRIERGLLTLSSEPQSFHLVKLVGEMDGSNAHDLEDELIRLENDGRSEIVLDLSQLKFIDSTGLAVILRAHRRMTGNSHRLSIVRPRGQVGRTFELTGLDTALSFAD